MMKKVAIISQKGGSGKTTLAINLAVASEISGKKTIVFDLDPQASSMAWRDSRDTPNPEVLSLHAARFPYTLEEVSRDGFEVVFFDTAPHAQKDALDAAHASDLLLIPCRASLVDLRAIHSSVQLAHIANKPAIAVLSQVPAVGTLKEEAIKAMEHYQINLAPVSIGHRVVFVHAFTFGKSVLEFDHQSKGSKEIEELFRFLYQYLENQKK